MSARRTGGWTSLLRVGLFLLGTGAFALWLGYVWMTRHDLTVWDKDWYCFYSAGRTFLDAGAARPYLEHCNANYFWMYPPYVLYPYALLSRLPPLAAYLAVMVGIWVALAAALALLRRSFAPVPTSTIAMFVVGSASLLGTLVVGQHSALLLLGVAGALWALRADRDYLAGVCLGILGLKPNWAAVFVLWLVVSRRWRTLGAMAAVGGVLVLSTLPMGLDAWVTYWTVVPEHVRTLLNAGDPGLSYPAHKLVTAEAFARSTIGAWSESIARAAWIGMEMLALACALFVWLRSESAAEQIAVAVLVALAANLYAEFYDGLALAVPAFAWWAGREASARGLWIASGVVALSVWSWQWFWVLANPGPGWPSLLGGMLLAWLVVETLRVRERLARPAGTAAG